MEVPSEDLEKYLCENLKNEDYKAIERRVISADAKEITDAYFGIYPKLFRRYVELAENADEENEKFVLTALKYIARKIDFETRYMSVLEVYQEVGPLKTMLYLCSELQEALSLEEECSFNYDLLDELRDDVLPYFLHKLRGFVKYFEENQRMEILLASGLFIDIFRSSHCKSFFLLDGLLTSVLSFLPICNKETSKVLAKYVGVCQEENKDVPPKPILLAVSLQEQLTPSTAGWLIPFLVYSPVYNICRCIPIFHDCLEKSENNPHSLSCVFTSLQAIVIPIDNESLPRDSLELYTDFIGKFLAVSVYPSMVESLRTKCLRLCRDFISKFEPVAQVLIIRRIISLITHDAYKDILEPQAIAWLLDCYRSQIGKHDCFSSELGFLWGDLAEVKYENLHDGVNFYAALMILAQYQALLKINKPLLKVVKEKVIVPLEANIAEWSHLVEIKGSKENETVPYLQTMMTETLRFISISLSNVNAS